MKTEFDIEVIKLVRAKRLAEGDSLRSVARIIGTSHSFPQEVEDMNTPCKYSAEHLYYLAQEFKCPITDLYPGPDRFPPKKDRK